MSITVTATDPVTGTVHTRCTEAAYTHVSVRDSVARFHLSHGAALRRGGRVFAVDAAVAPVEAPAVEDGADAGATCTVVVDHRGGRCGAPAVASFTSRRSGERFHECAHHLA